MQNFVTMIVYFLISWQQLSTCTAEPSPLRIFSFLSMLRSSNMVIQEVRRTAPEMFVTLEDEVRSLGYPVETHKVHTEDGYILILHRIPHGRENTTDTKAPRPPVLLQHGFPSNSDSFVALGPDLSPALIIANNGYDVWLGNIRGNAYSIKHETLRRKDPRFWKFSWHEAGFYDVPAMIDYILNATSQEKLFYIGHSMGSTMFHVAMSMRPEYNNKIRLHIALGPAVYLEELQNPINALQENIDYIKAFLDSFPTYEMDFHGDSLVTLIYLMCGEKAYFNKLCAVFVTWIMGNLDLNDTSKIGLLLARAGSTTSALILVHYMQIARADDFIMRDDGWKENLIKYGSTEPPKYPLGNVKAPVSLFGAESDIVTSPKAVKRLADALPNVVSVNIIKDKFFNHLGYISHPRMGEILYDNVIELLKLY